MKKWLAVSILVAGVLSPLLAQTDKQKNTKPVAGSRKERATASSASWNVVPDLDQRLARFVPVRMPFNSKGLSAREVQLVQKLVEAARWLDAIYWQQSDPEALKMLRQLQGSQNPQDKKLRRMLLINGSRFDLVDENRPFVGTERPAPGRGYFPEGLTREEIEKYVTQHPEKKDEIYSPSTVVRRQGDELEAVPYHVAYKEFLEPAAKALREAASLSGDTSFAEFLRKRADALLTDDYYSSDLLWVDLKNPKFDVIFAPYEVYLDDVLSVKTSFEAAVMIRNEAESRRLDIYQKYVPEIQQALPLAPADKPSKSGQPTPLEVMDTPFRAGDLTHGYQAVADNLPNDPRIHEAKGTKKIFFKNFMDARVQTVVLPIAKRLMRPDQASHVTPEGCLTAAVMHEIAHGIGPAFARTPSGKKEIAESIGPIYSGLEEAKADVVGMFGLQWLMDHDALPKARGQEFYSSYVGGIFRTVRFGVAEAHGRAVMMEFNYLAEKGAVGLDATKKRYVIDYAKFPSAIASLSKELLEIEATGDHERAEAWFSKYDKMPAELKAALDANKDVPVDFYPVFSFQEYVH
ncbi:MAG: dipeptidyl-peptidase 3 family protein [Acidobacteriaceae bacterium]